MTSDDLEIEPTDRTYGGGFMNPGGMFHMYRRLIVFPALVKNSILLQTNN